MDKKTNKARVCSVEGCGKKHLAKGYCNMHYLRQKVHGRVDTPGYPNYDTGVSKDPTYYVWLNMVGRCYRATWDSYKNYGARGITVCDRWHFGEDRKQPYFCFLEDMGNRPSPDYSIERIDNNKGYSAQNCCWATRTQQIHNQRKGKNNTSGYIGVVWDKSRSKWRVRVVSNSKYIHLGFFSDKVEGARAFDRWVIANRELNATTNFPREEYLS